MVATLAFVMCEMHKSARFVILRFWCIYDLLYKNLSMTIVYGSKHQSELRMLIFDWDTTKKLEMAAILNYKTVNIYQLINDVLVVFCTSRYVAVDTEISSLCWFLTELLRILGFRWRPSCFSYCAKCSRVPEWHTTVLRPLVSPQPESNIKVCHNEKSTSYPIRPFCHWTTSPNLS